jgi:phosphomannomutase
MRGDVVGMLCAQALGAQTVVSPVSSNTALEKCGAFPKIVRTKIGSPFVIAAMQAADRQDPVVGYEANGGFLLGSDVRINGRMLKALPTRDAMLPILLVLTTASTRGCKVSDLPAGLPERHTYSDRLQDFAAEKSRALLAQLEADSAATRAIMAPQSGGVTTVDTTDGLRVAFENGDIVHLRPSGNAPELRCYAEARTPERTEQLCRACLDRVRDLM